MYRSRVAALGVSIVRVAMNYVCGLLHLVAKERPTTVRVTAFRVTTASLNIATY